MALSVSRIFLYPVKECNPFEVESWEITSTGTLLYDREWAVLGPDGEPLTQPKVPALCFVHPKIDLEASTLTLEAKGMEPLTLTISKGVDDKNDDAGNVTMCGKKLQTIPEPEENIKAASEWFTKFLGIKCSWARSRSGLKFMYKANFLVTSQKSFDDLHERLPKEYKDHVDIINFRSNIVLSGGTPFQEESWSTLQIGENTFRHDKLCKICKATLIDRSSGSTMPEPLSTLSKYRATDEGVFFGSLMNWVQPQNPQGGPFIINKAQPVQFS